MQSLRGQFARVLMCLAVLTAMAGAVRAAPFAAHVMDARTGETLYARNADTRLHPASLTKMLTLYIVFDAIRRGEISLDTMVTVSEHAAKQPPSRLGLRKGQKIALRHLIRAAAIKSANDAAAAIGDALSGNEAAFAKRMNRTAKALGLTNSTFKNAHGLTVAGHLSTARDMSTLGRRLFYDFPEYYNIFSRRSEDAGVAKVANTNARFLDSYRGADGIKTGYTVAAGFNLTASAERGNVRIIATVFGGTSTAQRNAKVAELLNVGFAEAPANARVRKPAPAHIPAAPPPEPAQEPMLVASAQTAPMAGGMASGKTIRLVTTLARSPRPLPRPDREAARATAAAVAALQPSIADAVAAAVEPPPFQVVEAPAAAPAEPAELPFAVVAAGTAPPVRPLPAPTAAAAPAETAEPLPFAVVDAEGNVISAGAGTPAEAAPAQRPPARPMLVVPVTNPPAAELAAAEPEAAPAEDLAALALPADALPEPEPLAAEEEAGTELAAAETDTDTAPPVVIASLSAPALPAMPAVPAIAAAPVAVAALRPAPKAGELTVDPGEQVVVTRFSTSGGRHWGVNLGRFSSRAAAERALMRVGLSEGAVLGDGLQKVASGARGFDANVLGLTQDQAELACRRLAARAQDCRTLGP